MAVSKKKLTPKEEDTLSLTRTFDNVPQVLKKIPKEEFQKYFEQWQHPWNKGVAPKVTDWKEAAISWMYKCWYVFVF